MGCIKSKFKFKCMSGSNSNFRYRSRSSSSSNSRSKYNPNNLNIELYNACIENNPEQIKKLIKCGANINMRYGTDNLTLLLNAVYDNEYELTKRLLEYGADPNLTDRNLNTPLHIALSEGHHQIAELLIQSNTNINVNLQNDQGYAPIHCATLGWMINIINMLIENGANINIQDKRLNTPLHYAVYYSFDIIVQLLVNNYANIHLTNVNDMTPLCIAIEENDIVMLEILIDLPICYKLIQKAILRAKQSNNRQIIQILNNIKKEI